MQKLNVRFLVIDYVVKTDEYDWTNDENLYNETYNYGLDEDVASMYH